MRIFSGISDFLMKAEDEASITKFMENKDDYVRLIENASEVGPDNYTEEMIVNTVLAQILTVY